MPIKHHIVGQTFGKWKVLSEAERKILPSGVKRRFLCRCECGLQKTVGISDLIYGKSTACTKCKKPSGLKHGFARRGKKSRTYEIWSGMLKRCTNPKFKQFDDYGGRGIRVCDRWNSYLNFLSDMGEAPDGLTIDRRDNNGNYEPGNCRWATQLEQVRNSRHNRIITVRGFTGCVTEVVEHFGVNIGRVKGRLQKGWSAEDALFKP